MINMKHLKSSVEVFGESASLRETENVLCAFLFVHVHVIICVLKFEFGVQTPANETCTDSHA